MFCSHVLTASAEAMWTRCIQPVYPAKPFYCTIYPLKDPPRCMWKCDSSVAFQRCNTKQFPKKIKSKLQRFAVQAETVVSRKQISVRLERHNQLSWIKQADKPSLKSLSASSDGCGWRQLHKLSHTSDNFNRVTTKEAAPQNENCGCAAETCTMTPEETRALWTHSTDRCTPRQFRCAVQKQSGINGNSNRIFSVWVTCFWSEALTW